MKRIKLIITLTIISITLFINDTVKAVVEVKGNWSSFGSDNVCGTGSYGYTACYLPKYEFRVTLVDKTGKKVSGTKSIEYGYSKNGVTRKVDYTAAQKNNFVNPNRFEYRYSDEFNDYNPISTHTYYQVNMASNPSQYILPQTGLDRPEKYKEFTDAFIGSIHSKTTKYGIDPGTNNGYTFLTMFLYHSGFLDKNQSGGQYYNIDVDNIPNEYVKNKAVTISEYDYYLLIEPLYTIFYNEKPYGKLIYKYGTAGEIGDFLYNATTDENKMKSGYMAGLSLIFTYNAGSNLYTQPNEILKEFRTSRPLQTINTNDLKRYNTSNPTGDLAIRYNRRGKWAELSNTNYGYGVSVLRLKNNIRETDVDIPLSLTIDQCGNEVSEKANDGIISLKTSLIDSVAIDDKFFEYEENKFAKDVDSTSTVYCYDEFTYDFSNTLNALNSNGKNPFQKSETIEIKPGKLTVDRYCYIKDWVSYKRSTQSENFVKKFSTYTSQKIPLTLFNQTINLEASNTKIQQFNGNDYEFIIQPAPHPLIPNEYMGRSIIHISAEIEYSYKTASIYSVPSSITFGNDYKSSVDLSNISYGYSTNLINELKNGNINYNKVVTSHDNRKTVNYALTLNYEDTNGNADDTICSVISKTKGGTTGDPINDQIKFRTISLSNPFPARDATSRMPGSNWLGKDNYIRGYIKYNRGVLEEEVYQKDPIYVIDLTPSTMTKIREYNKKHNYGDIKLECSGENNTECMSKFLRDSSIFSSSVRGTCMITSNTYKDITRGITLEQFQQKLQNMESGNVFKQEGTYDSKYDLNNDKRINKNDALIYTYAEKTTPYYTCADKTFENSGYLGRGD